MAAVLTRLTPADYVATAWSGGTTTQLAIAPEGAVYARRDFLWRVSSATVELDESDFTALPDYDRLISTVRGEMTLSHNGGAALTLRPGDVHAFDGGDRTHARGRCTDFNLMTRKGVVTGAMSALRVDARGASLPCRADETALLYCARGACTLRCGAETLSLGAGDSALVRDAAEAVNLSGDADVFVARARVTG